MRFSLVAAIAAFVVTLVVLASDPLGVNQEDEIADLRARVVELECLHRMEEDGSYSHRTHDDLAECVYTRG